MKIDALYSSLTVIADEAESLTDVASRMRFNDVGSAAAARDILIELIWTTNGDGEAT